MATLRLNPCLVISLSLLANLSYAEEIFKPYSPPCMEREEIFEFTARPVCRRLGEDRYEISFAVKGNCDVTVGIVEADGKVVRHLGSGVLGGNAPAPFQKNSLKQTIYWDGKDDLEAYHKTPDKLKVRVMLGLKPVFDKRLGGMSPYNLPGWVVGMAIGPDAAYVLTKWPAFSPSGFQHIYIRKFDREGRYLGSLVPPPASLPEDKLGGMGYVEYEPGKRTLHGVSLDESVAGNAFYLPPLEGEAVGLEFQPALVGNRLYFANVGQTTGSKGSFLHYIYTDGSTDAMGLSGIPFAKGAFHSSPRLAASPDGKKIYLLPSAYRSPASASTARTVFATCVYAMPLDGTGPAVLWSGDPKKGGSGDQQMADALGIDCDQEGRVYVSDNINNRIQVFSPDGKLLKAIPIDRPDLLCVHRKTGAIYVQHQARVEGKSVNRITKFVSYDDPRKEFYMDVRGGWMALDQWSAKPRLWLAIRPDQDSWTSVTIWEERTGRFEQVLDFEAEARKEPGWFARWNAYGSLMSSESVCDPTREKLYYNRRLIFDLKTGAYEGAWRNPFATDDIAFDKRGYLHAHFNPEGYQPGVGRFDPERATKNGEKGGMTATYAECPYDYGVEGKGGLAGIVATRDQPGPMYFQDGLGVTMRGEIAEICNIYFVPKMDDEATSFFMQGLNATLASGVYKEERAYDQFLRQVQDAEKRGEQMYSIRRVPGVPLNGGTVWTFERSGELRKECAVIAGLRVQGLMMDEALSLYFVNNRQRLYEEKAFLSGRGGHFGDPKGKPTPFTGTLIKTKPDAYCRILTTKAPVAMDALPNRPAELSQYQEKAWCEGAEWLYAGASPIVPGGCVCPAQRIHLDWYRRVYVPEAYRHSFGVLDTNGNLVLHVGRYGNFDSSPGGKDGCKPGDTDIGMTAVRYIGGTDNYLAFEDWGERIVVLNLKYQVEESVAIGK